MDGQPVVRQIPRSLWEYCRFLSVLACTELYSTTDLVLTIVGVAAFIFALFSKTLADEFALKWGGLSKWWDLTIIGLLLAYRLLRANYAAYELVVAKMDASELALKKVVESKPRILPRFPDPVSIQTVPWARGGIVAFTTWVVRMRFVNDPPNSYPGSAAEDIVAYVRITHGGGCVEMDGRWADSDEPSTRGFGLSRSDLLSASFKIGVAHDLDIIMKDQTTGENYALNNDNYRFDRNAIPKHKLLGNCFQVQVRLRGPMVDESFAFEVQSVPGGLEVAQPVS